MKIAYFFEVFYPQINGVVTSTVNLALNLQKLGHEVLFFAPKIKAFSDPSVHGIDTYYVDSMELKKLYPGMGVTLPWSHKVASRIKRDGVDVLHFTGPFTLGLNAVNASRQLDLPLVQTFHTMLHESSYVKYLTKVDLPRGDLISWQYVRMYVNACDVITCPSQYVLDQVTRHFPKKRYVHINNGIDLSDFEHADPITKLKETYPAFNEKSFLFSGRLGQEKSVDVLIRGIAEALKGDPEIQLFLAGEGPKREDLEILTQELGIEANVHFLGLVPHSELLRSGLIHHARAFTTASKTEIQSMTVLEAIACGTPLILADVEAMREIIDGNGLYFPPDDVGELGRCLVQLATDDTMHASFKERTAHLAARYDGQTVARQFAELYESLVNPR